ncbi:hypothetical protein PG988_003472 [Apiospora saccharicola]
MPYHGRQSDVPRLQEIRQAQLDDRAGRLADPRFADAGEVLFLLQGLEERQLGIDPSLKKAAGALDGLGEHGMRL